MDEKRKQIFTVGLIIGVLTVGLAVLYKKTPRNKWGSTLSRIGRDLLGFARARYGNNPAIAAAEKSLERFEESVA